MKWGWPQEWVTSRVNRVSGSRLAALDSDPPPVITRGRRDAVHASPLTGQPNGLPRGPLVAAGLTPARDTVGVEIPPSAAEPRPPRLRYQAWPLTSGVARLFTWGGPVIVVAIFTAQKFNAPAWWLIAIGAVALVVGVALDRNATDELDKLGQKVRAASQAGPLSTPRLPHGSTSKSDARTTLR